MKPVWMVLSRRLLDRYAFILVIAGYNPRKDRTAMDYVYLLYVFIFFLVWIFAVLSLFASWAFQLLSLVQPQKPADSAALVSILILLSWLFFQLWRVSRISPVSFTDEDAALLCLTPVNRRALVILWFIQDWLVKVIPFSVLAVVIGFAQVEWQRQGDLDFLDLPIYAGAGLRALLVMMLVHLSAQLIVWAVGIFRVRKDEEYKKLRWGVLGAGLFVAICWIFLPHIFQIMLFPWSEALLAALSNQPLFPILFATITLTVTSFILMVYYAGELNLSRSAQETVRKDRLTAAIFVGNTELAAQMKQEESLGTTRRPSKIPLRSGLYALTWKSLIQSQRSFTLMSFGKSVLLFLTTIAIFLAPDPGSRVLVLGAWVLQIGQIASEQTRRVMKRWWLLSIQPFSFRQLISMALLPSAFLVMVSMWIAAGLIPMENSLVFIIAAPLISIWLFMTGIFDILRQIESEHLLSEDLPGFTIVGTIIGLLGLLLPIWFTVSFNNFLALLFVISVLAVENLLMWKWISFIWRTRK